MKENNEVRRDMKAQKKHKLIPPLANLITAFPKWRGYNKHPMDQDLIEGNDCSEWFTNTGQGLQLLNAHRSLP